MLQAFRDHKRWLMFIAMVLIIPSFVVTGIYSYNRIIEADNSVAKVGEVSISPEAFDRAQREQLDSLRVQMGESFRADILDNPEARKAILKRLMDDAALMQTAAKEYVEVSEAAAVQFIKGADALKVDGKFSPELYQRFLQSMGKSDQQFVYEIRRDLAKDALLSGVSATYPVPKGLVHSLHQILNEKRLVRTYIINASEFLDQVEVGGDEAKAYYDANVEKLFMVPENVKAQYVVFSPAVFEDKVRINEEEVKAYYEQNLGRFSVPEKRRASHILIEFGSDKEAARKTAEEVLAKVKADPASFDKLAREYSADFGSAQQGGDLGYFTASDMVKPFSDAVFSAAKGDIAGPVETEYGFHIIAVSGIEPASAKPFDEVKSVIEAEYRAQKAIEEFSLKADEFTNLVYEQPDTLEGVAEKFALKIETAPFVTRAGVQDEALKAVVTDRVAEALFSSEVLREKNNTSAIEVKANTLVAARVLEHQPKHARTFDEVKDYVVEQIKLEKAAEMAREAGEKKLAELQASKSLEGFSNEVWVSRVNPKGQPSELVDAEVAYPSHKLPAFIGTSVPGGAYMISYIEKNEMVEPKSHELKGLAAELSAVYGETDKEGYLEALKNKLGSEILNPAVISGEEKREDQ